MRAARPARRSALAGALAGCAALTGCAAFAGCAAARPDAPSGTPSAASSPGPQTRAEASGYTATSSHADVLAFLDALPADARRHRTTFGTTPDGRALPLVVWGAPAATADAARATGKTRLLVFANIHAGEVDGKEALLILLRDLAAGRHDAWADSVVLLVAPVYNADGTDRTARGNRPLQHGPPGPIGQRTTAAGLDLNRDFVRLAAPESQALVALIRDYDPHVVVDLHTTDGTPMAYGLTYAPGLHPNTPEGISADLFGRWLPQISARLAATGGPLSFHYGNVPGAFGEPAVAPRGWYSFSGQARYATNYAGLRGRYAVLSESYSYDPFAVRVRSSRRFVEEIAEQTWREASHVRRATAAADRASVVGQAVAVRSTFAALPAPVEVLLGRVDTLVTADGPVLRNTGAVIRETMPAYVRFHASETTTAPRAYVVHGREAVGAVRALLDVHGVRYDLTTLPSSSDAGPRTEHFRVDSLVAAARPSPNAPVRDVFGRWEAFQPGMLRIGDSAALVVPVDQPLGRLVVALLDPRSDDSVLAWGTVAADALVPGRPAPISRLP